MLNRFVCGKCATQVLMIGVAMGQLGLMPAWGQAAEWAEEIAVGNIVFRSEFPLSDVQTLVDDIEQLQQELEQTLDLKCSDREIQIHLFRTKYSYRRYLSVRVPQGVKRQAFYMPGTDAGRIYAYRHREMETDVRHEATHALLRNALPYIPLWIDEGLAEYFEVSPALRKQGNGHAADLRLAIRVGSWKPELTYLEGKKDFLEMRGPEYRDSWGLIHFFLHGPPEAQAAFKAYLQAIEQAEVPEPLSKTLPESLPNYERLIVRHLRGAQ